MLIKGRKRLIRIYRHMVNSIFYLFYKDPIIINAWIQIKNGKPISRNWGDELNIYIIEALTQRKVIVENESLYHKIFTSHKKYICIGSILGWYESKNAEIWGAGAMHKNTKVNICPMKIHSVRGILTRNLLINQGIKCPEVYGDPALLLSQLYQPNILKRHRLGIIPHHTDINNPLLNNFCKNNEKVILIDFTSYTKWTDIIDKIVSCQLIISSSLHGLIVSDSYGIPNKWVRFSSNNIVGGTFKFMDYFSSINRKGEVCKNISHINDLNIFLKD